MSDGGILITGGAGFIGRALLKILCHKYSITVLDSFHHCKKKEFLTFIERNNIADVNILEGNVSSNLNNLHNLDCVINLTENNDIQHSIDQPLDVFEENLTNSFFLLNWCRNNNAHFIFSSTPMVYDTANNSNQLSERSKIKPKNPYAAYKFAIEKTALSFYYTYDLPISIIRLFNPYGPYQKPEEGAIANMLYNKINKTKILIYGDGNQKRDFLFVDDAADAISKIIGNPDTYGQIFNIGYGKDVSIKNIALVIADSDDNIEFRLHMHPKNEIKRLICDNSKIKKILNWYPKIELKQGIKLFEKHLYKNKLN